jgi:hypothetical protein
MGGVSPESREKKVPFALVNARLFAINSIVFIVAFGGSRLDAAQHCTIAPALGRAYPAITRMR